jgi:hypothetical protein
MRSDCFIDTEDGGFTPTLILGFASDSDEDETIVVLAQGPRFDSIDDARAFIERAS